MMNSDKKTSKLTKVLIHKTHGGRKKDSKFWNDDVDLSKKNAIVDIPIERKKNIKRKVTQTTFIPIVLFLAITVVLIIARPDLFPFLDYHHVYKTIERIDNIPKEQEGPQILSQKPQPKTYPIRIVDVSSKGRSTEQPSLRRSSPSNSTNSMSSDFSLEGLVFSWKDKEGKRHFSNTNYPEDNPTLQVQTEINTYKKITRVRVTDNRIYVPVTMKNNGRSSTMWMLLDTGCSITNIPYSQLNRINAKYGRSMSLRIADGSTMSGREATIDLIQIGSQKERDFRVAGTKVAGSDNKGLLGLDFLKKGPFKVDYDRQMLVWM